MTKRFNPPGWMPGLLAASMLIAGCAGGPVATTPVGQGTPAAPALARVLPFGDAGASLPFAVTSAPGALMMISSLAGGHGELALNVETAGLAAGREPDATVPQAHRTLQAPWSATASPARADGPEGLVRWGDRRFKSPLAALSAAGTREPAAPNAASAQPFWVFQEAQGEPTHDAHVQARLAYQGSQCDVYVDEAVGGSLDDRARRMGQVFDQRIYATDIRLFGPPLVPPSATGERIALLVTPSVGNHGQESTVGYFSPRDLFSPDASPAALDATHSNQRLLLYVSADMVAHGHEEEYLGTLAHEFEHLINATHKFFGATPARQSEETWLDEGLAMYAMQANGYGLESPARLLFDHLHNFLAAPQAYSLTEWEHNPDQSAYGAVYLFITYLVDQFGEGLLPELVSSPQIGTEGVDRVLKRHGSSFAEAFQGWAGANLLDGTGVPREARYHYKSIRLGGTYGGRSLGGINLEALSLPQTGHMTLLPYSTAYFSMQGGAGTTYSLNVAELATRGVDGLLVTP